MACECDGVSFVCDECLKSRQTEREMEYSLDSIEWMSRAILDIAHHLGIDVGYPPNRPS